MLRRPEMDAIDRLYASDRLSYTDMTEPLRLGNASVAFESAGGIWIKMKSFGTAFGALLDPSGMDEMVAGCPTDCEMVSVHDAGLSERLQSRGFVLANPCSLFVMEKQVKLPEDTDFRVLDRSYLDFVAEHYSLFHDPEYIVFLLETQMLFGLFKGGEIVGFIGLHAEGAMGLLEVLPAFRRMGYGAELESCLCSYLQKKGLVPYGNVVDGNAASLALQASLGMTRASLCSIWLSRQ